ncbi:response regulator transcription factor [Arthrobacter sulfonylureivorans]|uniref:response regulator transcription factor n=1 Tax=Arthrobacter sulfonylureivorans TaxID=2486855 RepID=UPI0039E62DF6
MSDPGAAVVIEDDVDTRNLVCAVLLQSGFDVHAATGGREGIEAVRRRITSVVTLDIGLPDIDGFEVLRRIRQFSNCYVVMVTSRNDELDTLTALQLGADDYVTKPFRPRELRARIHAMLRRPRTPHPLELSAGSTAAAPLAPTAHQNILEHNGLALDSDKRTASLDGEELRLTRSEFNVLQEMLRSAGAVRSKAQLVKVVRGDYYPEDSYISEADERAIEVHVGNLRRKLKEDPHRPRWLVTVRGVGYRLAPERRT